MKKILVFLFVLVSAFAFATHNRAGEITYKRIAPFTQEVGGVTVPAYNYSITLIVYMDDDGSHNIADRCADTIYFGDGDYSVVNRINGNIGGCGCPSGVGCGEVIISDQNYRVKKNIYTVIHKYANAGTYLISMGDPNRNEDVQNIPNSVNQYFYIESLLVINNFTGANTSPQFNYDPIDKACALKCFYHNPGAYDPDGDSLSYELTACRGKGGTTIVGYTFPSAGIGGTFKIDNTGLITWCSPQYQAQYNIAFIVKEWRKNTNGVYEVVGYVLRDMQVIVEACPLNDPPLVIAPPDTCVEAGALIVKQIKVSDPNAGNTVVLTGEAGAFEVISPAATLNNTSGTMLNPNDSFYATFSWQTTCDHIRDQPYATVFKAKDNGLGEHLVYFTTYNIRVLPPSVKNVTAVPQGSGIQISWSPIACNPNSNPLVAYKIYRKEGCSPVTFTPCLSGVSPTSGFTYIGKTSASATSFIDDNNGNGLIVGQDYSYVVVGEYTDGTLTYGSSQVCTKLLRGKIPLLLNVDVLQTSEANGVIYVRWTRPLVKNGSIASSDEGIDTLSYIGPYSFTLKARLGSSTSFTDVQTFTGVYFLGVDTDYIHTGLNTQASGMEYMVEFAAKSNSITPEFVVTYTGSSQTASSIFLNATAGDRKIYLSWTSKTPWINKTYTIWRKAAPSQSYSALATTTATSYVDDNNIANHSTYCYKIVSSGEYPDSTIFKPLINTSQEACATAIDLTPPCLPSPTISAICPALSDNGLVYNNGAVTIVWNDVRNDSCGDDVVRYNLFYKPTPTDTYKLIRSNLLTSYLNDTLQLIAGCYAIQAVDSSGNLSPLSIDFCVDNCPIFELPNIFTPNEDGVNDFFKAVRVRQIKEIDMLVYDRWGNLVYQTKDPYFKWNGMSIKSNQLVSDGTLFYICDVYEPRLRGIIKRTLKGYVQVVR